MFGGRPVWQDSLCEHNKKQRVLRLWGRRVTQVRALCAFCLCVVRLCHASMDSRFSSVVVYPGSVCVFSCRVVVRLVCVCCGVAASVFFRVLGEKESLIRTYLDLCRALERPSEVADYHRQA